MKVVIEKNKIKVVGDLLDHLGETHKKRISWIVPKNPILRIAFWIVRKIGGKKGTNWTRKWKCQWMLIIKEEFPSREQALKREIEYLEKFHL